MRRVIFCRNRYKRVADAKAGERGDDSCLVSVRKMCLGNPIVYCGVGLGSVFEIECVDERHQDIFPCRDVDDRFGSDSCSSWTGSAPVTPKEKKKVRSD